MDYEITLLTVRNGAKTVFCEPIGHIQKDGDYIFSWQPAQMDNTTIKKAQDIAYKITNALGGRGIFGVELFIKGEEVYFSEVSPRPHDTGMVTMITQTQSEFALHIRAVLGLPLDFEFTTPGASAAYKTTKDTYEPKIEVPDSLFTKDSYVRIFGKPQSHIGRRMAVVLTKATTSKEALELSKKLVSQIKDVSAFNTKPN